MADFYSHVSLGARNARRVHRIVAETFIPNPENKPFVNHKDGNKENNSVSNLEWCTSSENVLHAYRTGKMKQTRLTIKDVETIRGSSKNKQELAKEYGLALHTIQRIRNNRTWKV